MLPLFIDDALAGQDPTVANAAGGTLSGNTLSFTKRPGTSGLTYAIQGSTDHVHQVMNEAA